MIDRLFAYGTLERPMMMGAITGRVPPCVPACLWGYRRGRLSGRSYPGLARDPAGEVRGTLYLGLTRRALALLDRYEGPEYRRVLQGLQTDCGRRRAWVYIQRPGIPLDGDWSRWSGVKKAASGGRVTGPSHLDRPVRVASRPARRAGPRIGRRNPGAEGTQAATSARPD